MILYAAYSPASDLICTTVRRSEIACKKALECHELRPLKSLLDDGYKITLIRIEKMEQEL